MPSLRRIDTAIARGLDFLAKDQAEDGGFISYSSASERPFRRVREWRTVFVPALMLCSLAGIDDGRSPQVCGRLADFLLAQKSKAWSFNYWAHDSPDRKTQNYPDDLDDTFCALAGLYRHDPSIVDEGVLADAVKLLLAVETAVGGPYRTWLVPADSASVWLDVDPAVNANVAYFLSLIGSRVPGLDRLMGDTIASGKFLSPYYPTDHAFVYYFARAYEGPEKARLLSMARRLQRNAGTDLDRALCISARVRLGDGQSMAGTVDRLLGGQRRDGSWPSAVFYADPVKDGKPYYSGGPALSTAFVLEALDLYRESVGGSRPAGASTRGEERLTKEVLTQGRHQCSGLPKELRTGLLVSLDKLAHGSNGAEIIGMAKRFNDSLAEPLSPLPESLVISAGLANLYGWLAYTIYDDFLDEEGRPALLPVANAAMRRSLDGFMDLLPSRPAFRTLVTRTFDAIDGANAWEQADCRLKRTAAGRLKVGAIPEYGDLSKLAERSLGHCLAPLAVLAAKGLEPGDAPWRKIMLAMRHYLIVRQLNDDAHDWPEDLVNGHITAVVELIMSDMKLRPGTYDASKLAQKARPVFWRSSLPKIHKLTGRHAYLSRRAFADSGLMRQDSGMDGLLDGLTASMDEALAMSGGADDFLRRWGHGKGKARP